MICIEDGTDMKREKDKKVIPDPIDDRKFQEWKEFANLTAGSNFLGQ